MHPAAWARPVPKAHCGPSDRAEGGLQGQTTLAERRSGDSERGYNCNLQLVGQAQDQGAWWQMAWLGHCAYYGTSGYTQDRRHRGVVVVDASDPHHPRVTAYLKNSHAMLNPHESLKVNARRRLLAADGAGPDYLNGKKSHWFAFYDISDCAHPKLLSQLSVPGYEGHAGSFAPDGRTYYGTTYGVGWAAIDISHPRHPRTILHYVPKNKLGAPHDLSVSKDGTRLYVAQPGNFVPFGTAGRDGLVVVDVSDIQFRRPHPKPKVISTFFWKDGGTAQQTDPVTIHGRRVVLVTDETGPGARPGNQASRADACKRGLPPFGFARLIDISHVRHPSLIAKLMLQVDNPKNCRHVITDFPRATANMDSYGYSSHYCGFDRTRNPDLLACDYLGAGVRVFDIRRPYHPREVAYYKPPAQRRAYLPGSGIWFDYSGPQTLAPRKGNGDRTTDRAMTQVRFVTRHGNTYLWFCSQDNGFQILRFTHGVLKHL